MTEANPYVLRYGNDKGDLLFGYLFDNKILCFIEPKEPFVLLDVISLEDAFWRLYVLTTDGRMGWVTVQFIRYLEEVKSND